MVKTINRNILIVSHRIKRERDEMQQELDNIERTLAESDQTEKLATCVEIFDMNRYRVIRKKAMINRLLRGAVLRHFVFVVNIN